MKEQKPAIKIIAITMLLVVSSIIMLGMSKTETTGINITITDELTIYEEELPRGVWDIYNQECRLYNKYKDYGYLK